MTTHPLKGQNFFKLTIARIDKDIEQVELLFLIGRKVKW